MTSIRQAMPQAMLTASLTALLTAMLQRMLHRCPKQSTDGRTYGLTDVNLQRSALSPNASPANTTPESAPHHPDHVVGPHLNERGVCDCGCPRCDNGTFGNPCICPDCIGRPACDLHTPEPTS